MSFPNAKVLEDAKELGWSERDIESARIHGLCNVNGVVLTHLTRYQYREMKFMLSKKDIRKIEKHLKDCPTCAEICDYHIQEKEGGGS